MWPTSLAATTWINSAARPSSRPKPSGSEPNLGRGLLARRVEHRGFGARRERGGYLEQQRRLADAGLAAYEDDRTRNEAAAKDAVDLADRRRRSDRVRLAELAQRLRPGARCRAGMRA